MKKTYQKPTLELMAVEKGWEYKSHPFFIIDELLTSYYIFETVAIYF